MKFHVVKDYPKSFDTLLVALPEHDGDQPALEDLSKLVDVDIAPELKRRKFTGKTGEVVTIRSGNNFGGNFVTIVGIGKDAQRTPDDTRLAAAAGLAESKKEHFTKLAMWFPPLDESAHLVRLVVEGMNLSEYEFVKYKKQTDDKEPIEAYFVVDANAHSSISRALDAAEATTAAVALARDLANEIPSTLTPTKLAEEAKRVGKAAGLSVDVKGPAEMEELGLHATLAVAAGSDQEARFIRMDYAPKSPKRHVVLVGKGVTYDSGGINIKPTAGGSLDEMKMDMAGSAAVIGAMTALSRLDVPVHVTAYVASAENMLGGSAYKPGDIVRAYDGTSIEVGNTDAEGRLTLADSISYAVANDKPDEIIDVATLTGAAIVALGQEIAALFGNDEKIVARFEEAAKETGEKLWRLPLPKEYEELIKSPLAELHNTGKGRAAGTITAALFLQHFAGGKPWAHLDIAGPAMADKDKGYIKRGGTGYGVRLLLDYLTRD